jgi:SPP1 family phage portal protein
MNYEEIIKSTDFKKIEEMFKGGKPEFGVSQEEAIKQYKVDKHDIYNKEKRPDKTINKNSPTNERDEAGNVKTVSTQVAVARIGLSYQELIVDRRVGFMLTVPVTNEAIYADKESQKEKALVDLVDRIQNDNKMDYKNKEIARRLMSEMEVAELWYFIENKEEKPRFTLRVKVLSPDLGDTLYPLYDKNGDMVAFGRAYKIKEDNKDIEHFDVYTADLEYKYINKNNAWTLDTEAVSYTSEGEIKVNPIPNVVKKIMVVYHSQNKPEWFNVQSLIDRREVLSSKHADMNDYFGSPLLKVKGTVEGYAQKGEEGKVMQISADGDASYLSWDSSPESVKNEKEDIKNDIFELSQTPDISFNSMKGMGTIAQFTMKAFFMDAHMAVSNKEEIFGIGLQRRINLIKACIGSVIDTSLAEVAKTVQIKPKITPYLPQNDTELIDNLTVSKTGGIISTESAVEQNPLVSDTKTEMERINNDKTGELAGLNG